MDASLKAYLNLPVSWEKFLTKDGAGDKTYNTPVILKCYPGGGGNRMVRTSTGEIKVSKEILYFVGADSNVALISVEDRMSDLQGRVFLILAVKPFYDPKGKLDLVEVYL
jgi:hypothetical protein